MKYFSTLLPPPNITGDLHLGHFWNATLQDTLIRFYKSKGIPTYWAVGLDHAGISFQSKHWELFKEGNQDSIDQQCEKSKDRILSQFKELNFSFNIKDFCFTCDERSKKIVIESFQQLVDEKIIFKSYRPVHWDPKLKTAISNEEIEFKPEIRTMYCIKYQLLHGKGHILVWTTEPETIPWDVALFINPEDKDKLYLRDCVATSPIKRKPLRFYLDSSIDMSFGSGIMKCSPLKNPVDYDLAVKHNLQFQYVPNSISREDAIKKLEACIEDKKDIESLVPYSRQSGSRLETKCHEQLALDSPKLAQEALKLWEKNSLKIHHESKSHIMECIFKNMRDWCISRQIRWGIKLPEIKNIGHRLSQEGIESNYDFQELSEDNVLDTWFSSSLWPIITTTDKESFFPFSLLISGQDIMAPWIAKMIFMSCHFKKQLPFKEIYLHGLVLDKDGQKMSKSKGNGVDPVSESKELGSDALKLFFLANTHYHANISYSRKKVEKYIRFLHKLSNAYKFLQSNKVDLKNHGFDDINLNVIERYFLEKLRQIKADLDDLYKRLKFSLITEKTMEFIEDFCNQYIEFFKLRRKTGQENHGFIAFLWNEVLYMLRPIAPSFSETTYREIYDHDMPEVMIAEEKKMSFDWFFQYMNTYENVRKKMGISREDPIKIRIVSKDKNIQILKDLLNLLNHEIETSSDVSSDPSLIFSIPNQDVMIEILPPSGLEDKFMELIKERQSWLSKEVKALRTILQGNKFEENAPKESVMEKKDKLRLCEKELEIYSKRCTS